MFRLLLIVSILFISIFAFSQAEITGNKKQQADSLYHQAFSTYFQKPDSSIVLFSKAYSLYVDLGDAKKQMTCLSRLSWLYKSVGRMDTALVLAYRAIEFGEENHLDTLLAETYLRLGNIYAQLGELEKAKRFYDKTINLGLPNTKNGALGAIGQLYRKKKMPDSAFFYLKGAYDYFCSQDTSTKSNIYNRSSISGSLGIVSFQQNRFKQGIDYLKESLRLAKKVGNTKNEISNLINMSIAYDMMGENQQAEKSIQQALLLSDSINSLKYKMRVIKVMVDHYVDSKQFEKAYHWNVQYHVLQDSLDKVDYAKIINENELKYRNRIQEEKQKRMVAEQKRKQLISSLFFSATLLLFILISVLLYRRLQRINKLRKEQEERASSMEKDLQKTKARLLVLDQHLVEHNQQIAELQNISKDEEGDIKEKHLKELEGITILSKEDWMQYTEVFELLHPNFISRILEKFPNLTEGDKRQLMMLKLGYSRQKAASILGISPDSVKKGQQRLSKKLQLENVTALREFIGRF